MAQQLVGTKYKDMDSAYQESVKRDEYKARRKAQEEAVGRVREFKKSGSDKYNSKQFYEVENLEDFDWRATGQGGSMTGYSDNGKKAAKNQEYGRGKARLGRSDVRKLMDAGHSADDIMKMGQEKGQQKGFKFGDNAQSFLQAKIAEQTGGTTPPDVPDESNTTIPVDASTNLDNSDNLHQEQQVHQEINANKEMNGGTINVGDVSGTIGMIDGSVNDQSITFIHQGNSQQQSNGGGGLDLNNPWIYGSEAADRDASLAKALAINNNTQARSDLRMKPYTARDAVAHANTDGIISGFDQRVMNTTDHFGNLSGVTSGSLLGIYDTISRFKPEPAEKIEPEYDDD